MKKNRKYLILTVILAIFTIILISCRKEDIDNKYFSNKSDFINIHGINVKLDNKNINGQRSPNWLYFNTKQDYESAINLLSSNTTDSLLSSFENALSFSSMRSSMSESTREAIEIEDDILATLINPVGRVRIGDNIFEIDAYNDSVLVYSADDTKSLMVFSTDDEIFDILEGKKDSGEKGCSAKNKVKNIEVGVSEIDCKVVYQKAGIYFSLQSKISKNNISGGADIYLYCEGYNGVTNRFIKNKDPQTYLIQSYSTGGNKRSYNYRPYSGTRKLVNFHFKVHFSATYSTINVGSFPLEINCGI